MLIRSKGRLEAEILALRQQINVLRRNAPKRVVFRTIAQLVLIGLYRLAPTIVDALAIVRPEAVLASRWISSFWRWKSRRRGGRPSIPLKVRRLIREPGEPAPGAPRTTANCSNSASTTARRALQGTWPGRGEGRHRVGGPFFPIILMASRRWTCASCRHSPSACYMASWSCGTIDVESCGWG